MEFRMRKRPEEEYQQSIIDAAKMVGWKHYHTRDSRKSPGDFPDLMLARAGRLIGVEIKAGTYTTTDGQYAWLAELERAGIEAVVSRPDDAPTRERWHLVETLDRVWTRLAAERRPVVLEKRIRRGVGTPLGLRRLALQPGALPTCGACKRAKVPCGTLPRHVAAAVGGGRIEFCTAVGCVAYDSAPFAPGSLVLINRGAE